MPLPHKTKWHHVNDAAIRKVLTDPEGGAATFGAWLDVPGIKSVGVGGAVNTTTLRGDNQLLDQQTIITGITLDFNYAKVSLDVLAVMTGSTVTDSGVAPNQLTRLRVLGTDAPAYWEFRARTTGTDSGIADGHLIFPKCMIAGFPDIGMAEEDYRTFTGGAVCIPRASDKAWFDIELNETAVLLGA